VSIGVITKTKYKYFWILACFSRMLTGAGLPTCAPLSLPADESSTGAGFPTCARLSLPADESSTGAGLLTCAPVVAA